MDGASALRKKSPNFFAGAPYTPPKITGPFFSKKPRVPPRKNPPPTPKKPHPSSPKKPRYATRKNPGLPQEKPTIPSASTLPSQAYYPNLTITPATNLMPRPQTPATRTDPSKLTPADIAKSLDAAESRLDWLEKEHMKLAMNHGSTERNVEDNAFQIKQKATGELSWVAIALAVAALVGLIVINHPCGKITLRDQTPQTQGGAR